MDDEIDTTQPGECLYSLWHRCWDGCWDYDFGGIKPDHQCYALQTWPIIKRTEKRIYFRGGDTGCVDWKRERTSFIDLSKFNADGVAWHRKLQELLHLSRPPEIQTRPKPKTISELKREMADAHPDRGGTNEAFIAARQRYVRGLAG